MMSLFSSFDTYYYYMALLPLLTCVWGFVGTHKHATTENMNCLYLNIVEMFFSTLKFKSMNLHVLTILPSLATVVLLMNFTSILPYNFPLTSQVSAVLLISAAFWLCLILFQVFNNVKSFVAHAIPEGAPLYLVWLLFLIELVSNMIRPVTLTVRLTANILSGHLLMALLSSLVLMVPALVVAYVGLNLIEILVSFIQTYIFLTMICLYYTDLG